MNVLTSDQLAFVAAKVHATEAQVVEVIESWAPKAQRALIHPNWDDHEFAWDTLRKSLLAPPQPEHDG